MAEGPRSHSDLGFYGRAGPPKTPSSAMWESLGISKRPSQRDLLATTPMERREYTMQQGAQVHLHKHCLSPDGHVRAAYAARHAAAHAAGHSPGRAGSAAIGSLKGEKGVFSMKEFRGMMQQLKSASMDSDKGSPLKGASIDSDKGSPLKGVSMESDKGSPLKGALTSVGESEGKVGAGKATAPPAAPAPAPAPTPAPTDAPAERRPVATMAMLKGKGSMRWSQSFRKTHSVADGDQEGGMSSQAAFLDRIRKMGAGHIQGKEFVRTLTRKRKPAIVTQGAVIGNPFARHTRKQRDEFCALIMGGSQDSERLAACRAALERDPNDRSLNDFERLLEFSRRCAFMADLTPVERFVFLRSARILRIKAGGAVDGQLSRVFVVLSGSIVGQKYGEEVVYTTGDAFGKVDMIQIARSAAEVDAIEGEELEERRMPAFWAEGGPLACRADADVMSVDEWDFERMWKAYNKTVRDGQRGASYVPTFLASIDLFRWWPWSDMQDFALEIEGMQVDRGMVLFKEGDLVDGVHVLQFGECRVERTDAASSPPKRYGLQASVGAGDDGLPKLSIHRSTGPRSVPLAACGPRTVFGEEMAGAFAGRGGGDADSRRGYQVTCTSDCWFLFVPKRLWKEMLHDKRRHERLLRSIDALRDIAANRQKWVGDRWERERETEEISRSKLPLLSRRSGARWSM